MADFCHAYDPGGLGCPHPGPCQPGCLGDFDWDALIHEGTLQVGYEVMLGICEGHGSTVFMHRTEEGVFMVHEGGDPTPDVRVLSAEEREKVLIAQTSA